MSGRWSEEQTTKFVNMYKDSENVWNIFTPEYKNREARLASLEHMVQEMNISTEQGQLNRSTIYPIAGTVWTTMASPTVYPVAAGQLGIQLLSNYSTLWYLHCVGVRSVADVSEVHTASTFSHLNLKMEVACTSKTSALWPYANGLTTASFRTLSNHQ
jgi:hypothetical protein